MSTIAGGSGSVNVLDAAVAYVRGLADGDEATRRRRAEAAAGLSQDHISTPAKVTWYDGGRFIRLNRPTGSHEKHRITFELDDDNVPLNERGEDYHVRYHIKKRGKIERFSSDARRRMMQKVAQVPHARLLQMPTFVTLTYPNEWDDDGRAWKEDLARFYIRFKRAYGDVPVVWKLEFQQRGAPHFHLLIYFSDATGYTAQFKQWVSLNWYECVRSGDQLHLLAGTRVEPVRSVRGVQFYCAKYMAKTVDIKKNVGRFWGVWNWRKLDIRPKQVLLTELEFYKLRRVLAKRLKKSSPKMKKQSNRYAGSWMFLSSDEAEKLVAWGIGP